MNSIGLEGTEVCIERGNLRRLSDYPLTDLWALWWRVSRALALSAIRRASPWLARSRQRTDLNTLDQHLLHDIGITREQADRESLKLFWQE